MWRERRGLGSFSQIHLRSRHDYRAIANIAAPVFYAILKLGPGLQSLRFGVQEKAFAENMIFWVTGLPYGLLNADKWLSVRFAHAAGRKIAVRVGTKIDADTGRTGHSYGCPN